MFQIQIEMAVTVESDIYTEPVWPKSCTIPYLPTYLSVFIR